MYCSDIIQYRADLCIEEERAKMFVNMQNESLYSQKHFVPCDAVFNL